MTNFVRAKVIQCIEVIDLGTFNEDTIRSLYIHLREPARLRSKANGAAPSLTLEIGDFFGHPERDKGIVHRYVAPIVNAFNEAIGGKQSKFEIKPVSYEQIIDDLNSELTELRVPPITLPREVALVLFASFQGMSLKLSNSVEVRIGFFVLPDAGGIEVCAAFLDPSGRTRLAVFPVFSMPNFFGLPQVMPDLFQEGWTLVRVPFVSGTLQLFQSHEMIEKDMPKQLFVHANIPLKTRLSPDGLK